MTVNQNQHLSTHNASTRYIGLDLTGARNAKTTLCVLESFKKEKKIFVLDVQAGLGASDNTSSDNVLIETLLDHAEGHFQPYLAVNAALSLPPCITCTRKTCPTPSACTVPEVKWMRRFLEEQHIQKDLTPYTQRPVELYLRHQVLEELPNKLRFDCDETLGGNRAPMTARMHYLKFHTQNKFSLLEVHPKLTVVAIGTALKIPQRYLTSYRSLDHGVSAREHIVHEICKYYELFVYERDEKKIAENLNSFDAFILALSAWFHDNDMKIKPPKGFPSSAGWLFIPKIHD